MHTEGLGLRVNDFEIQVVQNAAGSFLQAPPLPKHIALFFVFEYT